MIPEFIKIKNALWPVLPPGIHMATLEEIKNRFATNSHRQRLYLGFSKGIYMLKQAGCKQVFLDGSYVTGKPKPNDYDVCWNTSGINEDKIDTVFWNFDNGRKAQKTKYLGEYFPAYITEGETGKTFLDFFQMERNSGKTKGIIEILLGKIL